MRKVLWFLQLSSVRDGKFYPLSDSNYNFAKNMIIGINKNLNNDLDISVVLPANIDVSEEYEISEFFHKYNIGRVNAFRTSSVFGSRFDFDYDENLRLIKLYKPDIIFEHNPTHVRGWKTIAKELKSEAFIYTYFHWIDSPLFPKVDEDISYWWRQYDGILSADKVFFNSNYAISQIEDSLEASINFNFLTEKVDIVNKCFAVPPCYDRDISEYALNNVGSDGIVFNHRLSSLGYYKDNFDNFIKMLSLFEQDYGYIPNVYFTNPSRKQQPLILGLSSESICKLHFVELNEKEYYKLLGSDKVGIAPNCFLTSKGMWSIATMEAGVLGNAVMMPEMYGYQEMADPTFAGFYPDFAKGYNTFTNLIRNENYRRDVAWQFGNYATRFECKVVAKKFLDIIENDKTK